jgi:hypothetical protein
MPVVLSVVTKPAPGRLEESIELAEHGAKIMERHGAEQIRLLSAALGSESYGLMVLSSEFSSSEAFGKYYDSVMADDETRELLRRSAAASSPTAITSITTAVEVPTGRQSTGGRGPIVEVISSRLGPGQELQPAIELGSRAFAVLERLGARRCRLWQQTVAGSQSELFASTIEWESMTAYGRAMDRFAEDPDGQAILAQVTGPKAAVVTQSHDIFAELPL